MSDLNQLVRHTKAGHNVGSNKLQYFIDLYEKTSSGPICCFYTRKPEDIPNEEGYIELAEFKNLSADRGTDVIGCSRGCVPMAKQEELYRESLCKACVAEARGLLKTSHSLEN